MTLQGRLEYGKEFFCVADNRCGLLEHQVYVFMVSDPAEIRPHGNDRFSQGKGIPHLPCRPGICIGPFNNGNDEVSTLNCCLIAEKKPFLFPHIPHIRIISGLLRQVHVKQMRSQKPGN